METEVSYQLTRLLLQKGLAAIYLTGFLIIFFQYNSLVGKNGLEPVNDFIKRTNFRFTPSIFWIFGSKANFDLIFKSFASIGILLSLFALAGISESHGLWLSMLTWFLLWLIYLSFVNFGQTFYGFGWEILLLEAGFLAIFLGPANLEAPAIVIWLYRWLLFRVMFGAGLIKLRGDSCWRKLTCLFYHYETQPVPNPLSRYFHFLPKVIHKISVLFNHFVELVIPFFFFIPGFIWLAGLLTIFFQLTLILSGNLAWLNYITIVLCFSCFTDSQLQYLFTDNFISQFQDFIPLSQSHQAFLILLGIAITLLSIKPIINLFSRRQLMNSSYSNWHLVNTYGAFGSVTRERFEVIIEATDSLEINDETIWLEYEFKAKPGNPASKPALMSPYLYKIDWQIWFAAMSSYHYHPWFPQLLEKLLNQQKDIIKLFKYAPFQNSRPTYIRASLYHYRFSTNNELKNTGRYWQREFYREYFPACSKVDFAV